MIYQIGDEVYLENGLVGIIRSVITEPYRTYYAIGTKFTDGVVRYSESQIVGKTKPSQSDLIYSIRQGLGDIMNQGEDHNAMYEIAETLDFYINQFGKI